MHKSILRKNQTLTEQNHYDIIIIGTGAGGGTLARKLADSGKKILILERGDFLAKRKRELGYGRSFPEIEI